MKYGSNVLEVYFEGELLQKDVHYTEMGEVGAISNKIQILNWGESIASGYTFSFVVRGSYETEEVVENETV